MPRNFVDDEEDYMTMAVPGEKKARSQESSLRRAARRRQEGLARGKVPSRAELDEAEHIKRREALERPLDASNKGFQMMQKLGFTGGALGKDSSNKDSLTEPIAAQMRRDKGGIGISNGKSAGDKRKAAGSPDGFEGPTSADFDEYRAWRQRGAEGDKLERTVRTAMQITRYLDDEIADKPAGPETPALEINILWRALVRGNNDAGQKRHKPNSYDLHFPTEGNENWPRVLSDSESDDDLSRDIEVDSHAVQDENADAALDEFLALPPATRLAKIIEYQRHVHKYCMWCGLSYSDDDDMEKCPGPDERDHE